MPAQRECVIGIGAQERLIATLRKWHADIGRWYSVILLNEGIHRGIGVDSREGSYYNKSVPGHPSGEAGG